MTATFMLFMRLTTTLFITIAFWFTFAFISAATFLAVLTALTVISALAIFTMTIRIITISCHIFSPKKMKLNTHIPPISIFVKGKKTCIKNITENPCNNNFLSSIITLSELMV